MHDSILKPTKRRRRGYRFFFSRGDSGGNLQGRIGSQRLFIVTIFVAHLDGENALSEQRAPIMNGRQWITRTGNRLVDRIEQPESAIDLPQQRDSGIAAEPPTEEICCHFCATDP